MAVARLDPDQTSYVNDLSNPGVRFYRVHAFNAAGDSGFSNSVSADTTVACGGSPTPTPSATPTPTPSQVSVIVSEGSPTAGHTYQFFWGTTASNLDQNSGAFDGPQYTVNGLTGGQAYYFAGRSQNSAGTSVMSTPVAYTTLAGVREQRIDLSAPPR